MHGIELINATSAGALVNEAPSAITAIVGTAPKGPLNVMTLVKNDAEAVQFGVQLPGFTIPSFLASHFAEGGAPVIVINVYNPATMTTAVATEVAQMVNGKVRPAFPAVSGLVVKNQAGTTTHVLNTDYTVDEFGTIISKNYSTIAANAQLTLSYNKQDLTAVTATQIVGTASPRTGFKLLFDSLNTFGFEPRILVSPGFSQLAAVDAEMIVWAELLGAVAIVDAPSGTTVTAVKAGRTPSGAINFLIYNESVILVFPELKSYDPFSNTDINKPYSQYLSGLIGRIDADPVKGYEWSFSNQAFRTVTGMAVPLSGSAFYSGSDIQDLNDLGIVTVKREGLSPIVAWGNRSSAFPNVTSPITFIPIKRVMTIMGKAIQFSALQFLDRPINLVVIDQILAFGNAYIADLIGRGALIVGSEMIFDPAHNPVEEMAAGHLTFDIIAMPPPPLQHLTFRNTLNINLLSSLTEGVQ